MDATPKDYVTALAVLMRAAGGLAATAAVARGKPLAIDRETGRVEVIR